jgi:hypothetical protein
MELHDYAAIAQTSKMRQLFVGVLRIRLASVGGPGAIRETYRSSVECPGERFQPKYAAEPGRAGKGGSEATNAVR